MSTAGMMRRNRFADLALVGAVILLFVAGIVAFLLMGGT
jgi:hypothetical protein